MAEDARILALPANALRPGAPTPGVMRETAFDTDRATVMRVRAQPRAASGWHHHGARDVFGYVVRGQARFEFGPGGHGTVEVEEGGFFHVPAGLVHRDVHPLGAPRESVLAPVGDGPLAVNLVGPAGA
jgi:quercetin dioxygenase-like cupin family protein